MVSMLDCIRRVPVRLEEILTKREETFAALWAQYGPRLSEVTELVLIGSGTSYTGAFTAKYLMEKAAGLRVSVHAPAEFLHSLTVRNPSALYVFISQTGTSKLTGQALAYVRERGWMHAAVSEKATTNIAKAAAVFVDMGCGPEEYPMRTLGYSATVLTLMALGMEVGRRRGFLGEAQYGEYGKQAEAAAGNIGGVIDKTMEWLTGHRRNLLRADCLIFTGTGALYGVAQEGAVKVWETPQIPSFGYELEEGLHGPNFGYNPRHCVLVLNDGGAESPKAAALCKYMKFEMKNGFLLGADPIDGQDLAFTPMGGDCCCLEFAAAVQVIAYRLAVEQGRDLFAPHDNRVMNGYFNGHESL